MSDDEDFEMPEDDMPETKAVASVRPSAQPSILVTEEVEQHSNVSPQEVKSALQDLSPAPIEVPVQSSSPPLPAPEKSTLSLQKSIRTSFSPSKSKPLPVMNSTTVDRCLEGNMYRIVAKYRNTYDLDRLLSPHIQKKAETLDRFSAVHLLEAKSLPRNSLAPDFVKLNKQASARKSQEKPLSRRKSAQDLYNVDERFYRYQRDVEAKIRRLEEEKTRVEKANCTFSPEIISKKRGENPRSVEEFYVDMMKHENRVKAKVKAMQDQTSQAQKSLENSFFRPQICEKSVEMTKKSPQIPAHEKLYRRYKEKLQRHMRSDSAGDLLSASMDSAVTMDSNKPFTPAINKTSLEIVRNQPFEVYLTEDAKRRAKRLEQIPAETSVQSVSSANSQALLLKKFKDKFNEAWKMIDADETGFLTYSKTIDLLKSLHFIENNPGSKTHDSERALLRRFWTILQLNDEESAEKNNVETVILAILNFQGQETEANSAEGAEPSPVSTVCRMENGVLRLNPGDTKRLHKIFLAWYDHRNKCVQKSNKNPTFKVPVSHTYRPVLSEASKRLTEDRKTKLAEQGYASHTDFLVAEAAKRAQAQKDREAKAEKNAMQECTFQPKIDKKASKLIGVVENRVKDSIAEQYMTLVREVPATKTEVLYQFATVSHQRRDFLAKTAQEREVERNDVECTFAPDLSLTADYGKETEIEFVQPIKGVEKAVERVVKARRASVEIAAMRAKGTPYSSNWRAVSPGNREDTPEGPVTVLAVQVNGRAAELCIRRGDNIDSLINIFLAQHRITGDIADEVRSQLTTQYMQLAGPD